MDSVMYRQMWDHDRDPFKRLKRDLPFIFLCIEMEFAFVFGDTTNYGL